jgi:hypothetical protein
VARFAQLFRRLFTDEAYGKLLDKLAISRFAGASLELQQNILVFYQNPNAPDFNRKKPDQRSRTLKNIEQLRSLHLDKTAAHQPTPGS